MSHDHFTPLATYLCIGCPLGCRLEVDLPKGAVNLVVRGQLCRRGVDYACKEHSAPERQVTSSVRIHGAAWPRLPVKTRSPVPKGAMEAVCDALRTVVWTAPVQAGEVIVANVAGLGIDVIATRTLASKN